MKTKVIFVIVILALLSAAESFPLSGADLDKPNLRISPDAFYLPNCKCLHLTTRDFNNQPKNSSGRVVYKDPFHFQDDSPHGVASFNTSFTFKIEQVLEPDRKDARPGAGFAFMLVPQEYITAPKDSFGEYLGLLNKTMIGNNNSHLVAVEFDNVENRDFGDKNANHIGLDVNSVVSLTAYNLTDDLSLTRNLTLTAWIEYDGANNCLDVRMSNTSSRPRDYILRSNLTSLRIQLSEILAEETFVGFSAATGADCFQFHSILSWNFSISPVKRCRGWNCNKVGYSIAVSVAGVAFIILLLLAWRLLFRKKDMNRTATLPEDINTTRFSYKELHVATKGFSKKQLLGKGGFAKVYLGKLKDGTLVAIKYLRCDNKRSSKEDVLEYQDVTLEQFVSEISVIGRLRHRNLVGLRGICYERRKLLLVYEYMANKSLDRFIFQDGPVTLNWEQRLNILKGVAEGLAFLHQGWQQLILHRDVKAANVLLDSMFNAKLGDFGFSKFVEHGTGSMILTMVGTPGYIAPEIVGGRKSTEKTDVYSFGILVLEVVSGRRCTSRSRDMDNEDCSLLDYVWDLFRENREVEAVDVKLQGAFDKVEAQQVISIGLLCCHTDPYARPSMRSCCQMLEGQLPVHEVSAHKPQTPPVHSPLLSLNGLSFSSSVSELPSSVQEAGSTAFSNP